MSEKLKSKSNLKYTNHSSMKHKLLINAANCKIPPSELLANVTSHKKCQKSVRNDLEISHIIELLDVIADSNVILKSSVPPSEPIFRPYPLKICFESYSEFSTSEKVLYLRNNDSVNRRVKVEKLDSKHFSVSGPRRPNSLNPLLHSKIAPGMEVCFIITFKPQNIATYSADLIVATEREKFIVPLLALGHRAALDLPDCIEFSKVLVKSLKQRTLICQNIGSGDAVLSFFCDQAANDGAYRNKETFSVNPSKLYLPAGESATLNIAFQPNHVRNYEGALVASYADGTKTYTTLRGSSSAVNIDLSTRDLEIEPTYINLTSQRTLRIYNRSEECVSFQWTAFSNYFAEETERTRLYHEIDVMRITEEQLGLGHGLNTSNSCSFLSAKDIYDAGEGQGVKDLDESLFGETKHCYVNTGDYPESYSTETDTLKSKEISYFSMHQKFKHLKRAIEQDKMLFEDDAFELLPIEGSVRANSYIDIIVSFRPKLAAELEACAYLDVVGKEERIPVWLRALGTAPFVDFSFSEFNFGNVYIGLPTKQMIAIVNKGSIPASWSLISKEDETWSKENVIDFFPNVGLLEPGDVVQVNFTLTGITLGEFCKNVEVVVQGSNRVSRCKLFGLVVGPTFFLNLDAIDFGLISCGITSMRACILTNSSDIPMRWQARVPQDSNPRQTEFRILPHSVGLLYPKESIDISLQLHPHTIKVYNEYKFVIDVENVGEELLIVPIHATSNVPAVKLDLQTIDYGKCFLRYQEVRSLKLANTSPDFVGAFKVLLPDFVCANENFSLQIEPNEGLLESSCTTEIVVSVVCLMPGKLRIPFMIMLEGSQDPPLHCTLSAFGVGPNVLASQDSISWGKIACLYNSTRKLTLFNDSKIPAPFRIQCKKEKSSFHVDICEGILLPQESVELTITANLNDVATHNDELHVMVEQGDRVVIGLSAVGIGSTLWCDDNMSALDFGTVLTCGITTREVVVENRGRRAQSLRWINRIIEQDLVGQSKGRGKTKIAPKDTAIIEKELSCTFSVTPSEIILDPRAAVVFTFRGNSATCGVKEEILSCESVIISPMKSKKGVPTEVFNTKITAHFVTPLLEFSPSTLSFSYAYDPNFPDAPSCENQSLMLRNVGSLQIELMLNTVLPFSLDSYEYSIEPDSCVEVTVHFNPKYRQDRITHTVESKLTASYAGHPQIDNILLTGHISFPNLSFPTDNIDFGCILNDTTSTRSFRITNPTCVEARFHWSFLDLKNHLESESMELCRRSTSSIPIGQAFDILPIRSILSPGESEDVEFVFYGHSNSRLSGQCLCEVEGGPEYLFNLSGEAENTGFRLDKGAVDFGKVILFGCQEREIRIINSGKVPLPFRAVLSDNSPFVEMLSIYPSVGIVPALQKKQRLPCTSIISSSLVQEVGSNNEIKLIVKFHPNLPVSFNETISIEVGHFESVKVELYGEGVYPIVLVSLPRIDCHPDWLLYMGKARMSLMSKKESSEVHKLPTPPSLRTTIGLDRKTPLESSRSFNSACSGQIVSSYASTPRSKSGSRKNNKPLDSEMPLLSMIAMPLNKKTESKYFPTELEVEMEALRLVYVDHLKIKESVTNCSEVTKCDSSFTLEKLLDSNQISLKSLSGISRNEFSTANLNHSLSKSMSNLFTDVFEESSLYASNHLSAVNSDVKNEPEKIPVIDIEVSPELELKFETAKVMPNIYNKKSKKDNVMPYILSHHLADLGYIIMGTSKTCTFQIVNSGKMGPVSWCFDKRLLTGTGYSVDPSRVTRLLEGSSVTITISFQARNSYDFGTREVQLPISIQNGPLSLITLRVCISAPKVEISTSLLNFGDVTVGTGKMMCLQLFNPGKLTSDWEFKGTLRGKENRDAGRFEIIPSSGHLLPNQRVNIMVEFIPLESQRHSCKMNLIVANNSNDSTLCLQGNGLLPQITFDLSLVKFPVVLPGSMGTSLPVTLKNESEGEIEIFSIDFDQQHKEEDQILLEAQGYDKNNIIRASVRIPGDKHYLSQFAFDISSSDRVNPGSECGGGLEKKGNCPLLLANGMIEKFSHLRSEGLSYDLIISGPPLIGTSTLAHAIAEYYNIVAFSLDEIIEKASSIDSPLGKCLREVLNRFTPQEKIKWEESLAAAALAAEEEKQVAILALEAQAKTKKSTKITKASPQSIPEPGPCEIEYTNMLKPKRLDAILLENILQWRIAQNDCSKGCIIDSFSCSLVSENVNVVEVLKKVMTSATVLELRHKSADLYKNHLNAIRNEALSQLSLLAENDSSTQSNSNTFIGLGVNESDLDTKKPEVIDLFSPPKNEKSAVEGKEISAEDDHLLPKFSSKLVGIPGVATWRKLIDEEIWGLSDIQRKQYEECAKKFRWLIQQRAENLLRRVNILLSRMYEDCCSQSEDSCGIAPQLDVGSEHLSLPSIEKYGEWSSKFQTFAICLNGFIKCDPPCDTYSLPKWANFRLKAALEVLPCPLIPLQDSSYLPLEPSTTYQIIRRPSECSPQCPPLNFSINQDINIVGAAAINPCPYRWVLQPHESISFNIQFASNEIGNYKTSLGFECVGTGRKFFLEAVAECCVPSISTNPVNVFMNRIKCAPQGDFPPVVKRYVISDKTYNFGPLICWRTPSERLYSDTGTEGRLNDSTEQHELQEHYKLLTKLNSDIFRLSNSGVLPVHISLTWIQPKAPNFSLPSPALKKTKSKSRKSSALTQDFTNTEIYFASPESFQLNEGETQEIRIWAFPRDEKEYKGTLVVNIKDNPSPVEFPVCCSGGAALAALTLQDSSSNQIEIQPELVKRNNSNVSMQINKRLKTPEGKETIDASILSVTTDCSTVDLIFDKLLRARSDMRTMILKNIGKVRIKWDLTASHLYARKNVLIKIEKCEENDLVFKGFLEVGESVLINVIYHAIEESVLDEVITIKYCDECTDLNARTDDLTLPHGTVRKINIRIQAESYDIKAIVLGVTMSSDFRPNCILPKGQLDFGRVRVGDKKLQTFKISNNGKYDIYFKIFFSNKKVASFFSITSPSGTILPGSEVEVGVLFLALSEVHLKKNCDLRCTILEPRTGEKVEEMSISIHASALWSVLRMQPACEISFGPVPINSPFSSKNIEVKNDGEFPCTFVFFSSKVKLSPLIQGYLELLQDIPEGLLTPEELDIVNNSLPLQSRGGSATDKKPQGKVNKASVGLMDKIGKSLNVEQFTVYPSCGTVQPGQTTVIQITFTPIGSKTYKEILELRTSSTQPNTHSRFELLGESCIPGIDTKNWSSIFEEQIVVSSLDEANIYRTFCQIQSLTPAIFAEAERVLLFGSMPTVCNTQGNWSGSCERLKIFNNSKVHCTINFEINAPLSNQLSASTTSKPKTAKKTSLAAITIDNAFSVQPSQWEIPPQEYRFVSVYFNPTEMKKYEARFLARVNCLEEVEESNLEFNMIGQGALPIITLEKPLARESNVMFDFDRVSVGMTRTLPIVLVNRGVISATCIFSMNCEGESGRHSRRSPFSFLYQGMSLDFAVGERKEFQVVFQPIISDLEEVNPSVPSKPKEFSTVMRIDVLQNAFGTIYCHLKGVCVSPDISIEPLKSTSQVHCERDDNISFEDVNLPLEALNKSKMQKSVVTFDSIVSEETSFKLRNLSTSVIKFEFSSHQHFQFLPSVGFIAEKETKVITGKFTPTGILNYVQEPISVTTHRIADDVNNAFSKNWDNTQETLRIGTQEEINYLDSSNSKVANTSTKSSNKGVKIQNLYSGIRLGPPAQPDEIQMVYVKVPEPICVINSESKYLHSLYCNAVSDVSRYELIIEGCVIDTNGMQILNFRPTPILQSCSHSFSIKNLAISRLKFSWQLEPCNYNLGLDLAKNHGLSPFDIAPGFGVIEPGAEQTFEVCFSPIDVDNFNYTLSANMPSVLERTDQLSILLRGRSIRPLCHFEMNLSSDYLLRRATENLSNENGQFGNPIEARSVRVCEVTSRGTQTRNKVVIHVLNPTSIVYDFSWEPVAKQNLSWQCLTPKGMILAGKRGEMIFEFTPRSGDEDIVSEAFMKFIIKDHGVSELFLFVGHVADPLVHLDRVCLDFGAVMLGMVCSETIYIINSDTLPYNFSFDKKSLQLEFGSDSSASDVSRTRKKRPILDIYPAQAIVQPGERVPVIVTFCPREEKYHNTNLSCAVRKKPSKLKLNIKGEGYAVHAKVSMDFSLSEDDNRPATELICSPAINTLQFGQVCLKDKAVHKIYIQNLGKFDLSYNLEYISNLKDGKGGRSVADSIKISASAVENFMDMMADKPMMNGNVGRNQHFELSIEFSPTNNFSLDNSKLVLTLAMSVKHVYILRLEGTGTSPELHFSFLKHNFGPCFVPQTGETPSNEVEILRVENRSAVKPMSLECNFVQNSCLKVDCQSQVIDAKKNIDIPIEFFPHESKEYIFMVPFLVNGCYPVKVAVLGEGCQAKLELADPSQSEIQFSSVPSNSIASKSLKVINHSKKSIQVQLEEEKLNGIGRLTEKGISFSPEEQITLLPRGTMNIELKFCPTCRIPEFLESLKICTSASKEPKILCLIKGKSTGISVRLSQTYLSLGTVCLGTSKHQKISIENEGDVPVRYHWDQSTFGKDFMITPLTGALRPSSSAVIDVAFRPQAINNDIQMENILLHFSSSNSKNIISAHNLMLSCSGTCIAQPEKDFKTLLFQTNVRQKNTQKISISNCTEQTWLLSPVLESHGMWEAESHITIEPKASAEYIISYLPYTMTNNRSEHQGTLFIPLPVGTGLMYKLQGISNPPVPEGSVMELNIPAKTPLVFSIPVKNWTMKPVPFRVSIAMGEDTLKSTQLKGAAMIEVPKLGIKPFSMQFLAYCPSVTSAIVTFTCPDSGEYQFHNISITAVESGVVGTITLDAQIRSTAKRILTIENPLPLDSNVSLGKILEKKENFKVPKVQKVSSNFLSDWWECDCPYVNIREVIPLQGSKEGSFEIEYRPLLPFENGKADEKTILYIYTVELGTYKYDLQLTTSPAIDSGKLKFSTMLGSVYPMAEILSIDVYNGLETAEFECHVEKYSRNFMVAPKVQAPPLLPNLAWEGQKVSISVTFDPDNVGTLEDNLLISSKKFGVYRCPLFGVCTTPQPQGPYRISSSSTKEVSFRNPFSMPKEFSFCTDNKAFLIVGNSKEILSAKAMKKIQIKFVASLESQNSVAAQLFVQHKELNSSCWVFYLLGVE